MVGALKDHLRARNEGFASSFLELEIKFVGFDGYTISSSRIP